MDAVRTRAIRIAYYAIKDANGNTVRLGAKRFVKLPADAADDALDIAVRQYFLESLEPDSLTFHFGPYAAVERPRKGDQAAQVVERNGQSVFKVAEAGSLSIQPREFILAGSNEYVEMDALMGASLYANVRNTDIGLSHISTIIDPGWRGTLQIGICNATGVSKPLHYLDALCIVRFHRLARAAPSELVSRLLARRPHADADWWLVEAEPGRPYFPVRRDFSDAAATARLAKEKRARLWRERFNTGLQWAGIGSLGAVLLFLAVKFQQIKDASEYVGRLVAVESRLAELDKIQETFHIIDSGSHRLNFADPDSLELTIPIKPAQAQPPIVTVNVGTLENTDYAVQVRYSYADANRSQVNAAKVIFRALRADIPPQDYVAYWLAARPSPTAQAAAH